MAWLFLVLAGCLEVIFALIIGVLAFHERPDLPTLSGATLIIVSGLYTLNRERQRRRDSRLPT